MHILILTSGPFTHDLFMCSGITSSDTASRFLRSVIHAVEFSVLRIKPGMLEVWDEIHSSALIIKKEARWLYAELKSHISFQISSVAYLKL